MADEQAKLLRQPGDLTEKQVLAVGSLGPLVIGTAEAHGQDRQMPRLLRRPCRESSTGPLRDSGAVPQAELEQAKKLAEFLETKGFASHGSPLGFRVALK